MNLSRVDEELRSALNDSHPSHGLLPVQIETDHTLATAEAAALAGYHVRRSGALTRFFSAKLTEAEISSLSEQPWLRRISLAKRTHRS